MSVETIYDDYILLGYSSDFIMNLKKINITPPQLRPNEMERLKSLKGEYE